MSNPTVDGPGAAAEALRVEGDAVLAFGMVEAGERSVDCSRLVVDPQRPRDLSRLDLDPYGYGQLALVCNSNEIQALGGVADPVEAAVAARARYGADVVVVKRGAVGATIVTAGVTHVGPHPTMSVWPIGSGDVFAGAFAHCWGGGADAVEAARAASAAAAWWCGTRAMTVPAEILDGGPPQHPEVAADEMKVPPTPRVYLAGPFFDLPQRWLVERVRSSLVGLGAEVFSPYHDVGPGGDEVAAADLEGLRDCGAVLALADGWDAGTLYECGWASRGHIPIIAFGANSSSEAAKMLVGDGAEMHSDLSTAVYRSIWAAGPWHTCGVSTSGIVTCWGSDSSEEAAPPVIYTAISMGDTHLCGLRLDGTVHCQGSNISGESDAPDGVFSAVSAGYAHSCGLRGDGTVECWGSNADGKADAPQGTFISVSASAFESCAVRADTTITCWGDTFGSPPSRSGYKSVSVHVFHSCAVHRNGAVSCWGSDVAGQASPPANN